MGEANKHSGRVGPLHVDLTLPDPEAGAGNRQPAAWPAAGFASGGRHGMPWSAWRRGWQRLAPALVWMLMAGVAWWLHEHRAGGYTLLGVAEAPREEVAPLETGRLELLHVSVGQAVQAGAALGRLDATLLDAEIAQAEAEGRRTQAALEAQAALAAAELKELQETLSGFQQGILQLDRQFETGVAEAEVALQEQKLRQAQDQAELEKLSELLVREEGLLSQGLVFDDKVNLLRIQRHALGGKAALFPESLRIGEAGLKQARARQSAWRKWIGAEDGNTTEAILAKLSLRIERFEERRAGLEREQEAQQAATRATRERLLLRRASLTLRARRAGVVTALFHLPGEVVRASEAVLQLVPESSRQIIGLLPEENAPPWQVGTPVQVQPLSAGGPALRAHVTALGPEIQTAPGGRGTAALPRVRGRQVRLELAERSALLPGQSVRIQAQPSAWSTIWSFSLGGGVAGHGDAPAVR